MPPGIWESLHQKATDSELAEQILKYISYNWHMEDLNGGFEDGQLDMLIWCKADNWSGDQLIDQNGQALLVMEVNCDDVVVTTTILGGFSCDGERKLNFDGEHCQDTWPQRIDTSRNGYCWI